MNHRFTLKWLAFYGGALVAVLTLFSLTTAYGTANLKAPHKIDGRYLLPVGSLPKCQSTQPLALLVQQSGRYLTGAIVTTDADETQIQVAQERPSLHGDWDNQQLTLDGSLADPSLAAAPGCSGAISVRATVSPIANGLMQDQMMGTIARGAARSTFLSTREAPKVAEGH